VSALVPSFGSHPCSQRASLLHTYLAANHAVPRDAVWYEHKMRHDAHHCSAPVFRQVPGLPAWLCRAPQGSKIDIQLPADTTGLFLALVPQLCIRPHHAPWYDNHDPGSPRARPAAFSSRSHAIQYTENANQNGGSSWQWRAQVHRQENLCHGGHHPQCGRCKTGRESIHRAERYTLCG